MRVVDAIARILKIEGAEFLSAYPTTPLTQAAARADIRPVLCRQERVGVGIADGYARTSNGAKLAAFCMQYGPGAVLSHEKYRTRDIGGRYADLARAMGGWAERVERPAEIAAAFARARRATENGQAALLEFVTSQETAFSHRGALR